MVRLDAMNLRILELLQRDARQSYADVARALDRSESTVRDRILGLERAGVIEGYRAVVDTGALGLAGKAMVRARVDYGAVDQVARRLAERPGVVRAYHTGGDTNLAFAVVAPDLRELERFLQSEAQALGLRDLRTVVVLDTVAEQAPLQFTRLVAAPRVV